MEQFDRNYYQNVVAVGTDGDSVMLGTEFRGYLRKPTDHGWLAIHCSGYKLELAFKIVKKLKLYDKISCFLLSIYYFYRNSDLNRALLKDSYKILN